MISISYRHPSRLWGVHRQLVELVRELARPMTLRGSRATRRCTLRKTASHTLAVMRFECDDEPRGIVEQRVECAGLVVSRDAQRRAVADVAVPQRAGVFGLPAKTRMSIEPCVGAALVQRRAPGRSLSQRPDCRTRSRAKEQRILVRPAAHAMLGDSS